MFFILPGMQENASVNINFLEYYYDNREKGQYDNKITGFGVIGNFAQVSWAGDNNNVNELFLYDKFNDICNKYHKYSTKLIFDCSSLYINNLNSHDMLGHAILNRAFSYGDTELVVGNHYAYEYFSNYYPTAFIDKHPLMEEKDGYDYDFHRHHLYEYQVLDNKINKTKTRIYVNRGCANCSHDKQQECHREENICASVFSNRTIYPKCELYNSNIHRNVLIKNDTLDFIEKGYTQFILPNYSHYPLIQIEEYVKNIIKPEYFEEAVNYVALKVGLK
jgi:hypothetical protein